MSFDSIKQSIVNMEKMPQVSSNVMLEAVVCLLNDTYRYDQKSNIVELPTEGGPDGAADLLKKELSLLLAFNALYEKNKQAMDELPDILKRKLGEIVPQMQASIASMEVAEKERLALEAEQEKLAEELRKLEEKQRKVKEISDKNEAMRKEIERLSDINLEAIEEENKKLQEECAKRQEQEKELMEKKTEAQTAFDQVDGEVKDLIAQIGSLNSDRDTKLNEKSDKEKEKSEIEIGIKKTEADIKELEKWIGESGEKAAELKEKYNELRDQFAMLFNMWNSMKDDSFLRENLYCVKEKEAPLLEENYPDLKVASTKVETVEDFDAWHEKLGERIKKLVGIYEKSVLNLSEAVRKLKKK